MVTTTMNGSALKNWRDDMANHTFLVDDNEFLDRVQDTYTASELVEALDLRTEDIIDAFNFLITDNKHKLEEAHR